MSGDPLQLGELEPSLRLVRLARKRYERERTGEACIEWRDLLRDVRRDYPDEMGVLAEAYLFAAEMIRLDLDSD